MVSPSTPDCGPELRDLAELRIDLRTARLVYPATAGYLRMAEDLRLALAAVGAAPADLRLETEWDHRVPPPALVVLGNLMDSTLVRRLYLEAYDFTDLSFPGPGGFTLRTIRDPMGNGVDVVLVGGSDRDGVQMAAAELVNAARRTDGILGYLNRVQLGCWAKPAELDMARLLADTEAVWARVGASGSWEYMERIALAGVGYLRTADERYLGLFRRELHHFIAHDVYQSHPEAKPMLHGRMHQLLLVWDLVRDHALFEPAERREVDAMFLHVGRSEEGVAYIRKRCREKFVRFNHATRAGLDAFFVGRYFQRRHGHPEAAEWLRDARELFETQFTSAKPMEDSWGHQWLASMHNTLIYALAAGRDDYVQSDAFRRAADRALLAHGTVGPRVYLAACAMATRDARYLSFESDGEAMVRAAARHQLGTSVDPKKPAYFEEVLRTFMWTSRIERRADLLGLKVAPLDELWMKSIDSPEFSPPGIFASSVEPGEGFDKLAMREGWAPEDFYLLLDGISGGVHAYQDANCLVWLRDGGAQWFMPRSGYQHAMDARAHTGVNALLDGRGGPQLNRYARLLYREENDEFMAVGTALAGAGETIWERHLLRRRGAWTLVLDRVVARREGELLVERFWYPAGEREVRPNGFAAAQPVDGRNVTLHVAVATQEPALTAEGCVERSRSRVSAGGEVNLAALLSTTGDAGIGPGILQATDAGVVITQGSAIPVAVVLLVEAGVGCGLRLTARAGRTLTLGRPGRPLVPASGQSLPLNLLRVADVTDLTFTNLVDDPITAVAGTEALQVAGTRGGKVMAWTAGQQECWRADLGEPVSALEISQGEVVAGGEHGRLRLFDENGRERWTVDIPWVTIPWAYWSEERSRIREIAAADINGDGREEILVSNADRRVYAFDRAGRELWKRPIEWGVYTAMWPGRHHGQFSLLGGTARPSIFGFVKLLDAQGAVTGHFQRVDTVSWCMPSAIRDLQQLDLGADGLITLEAVDANLGQVIAFGPDGAIHWDCDIGAAAGALACAVADRRVYVSSDAGFVVALAATDGRRLWDAWLGEPVDLLWVTIDGRILAVSRRGVIWILASTGEVLGRCDLHEAITALPRPGNHRGPGRCFLLGTASGRVCTLV
ncbi:MAG: PQQ-binding-like beta-propeller repeat protein [Opitutaceae bacterium]